MSDRVPITGFGSPVNLGRPMEVDKVKYQATAQQTFRLAGHGMVEEDQELVVSEHIAAWAEANPGYLLLGETVEVEQPAPEPDDDEEPEDGESADEPEPGADVPASPAARQLAAEHGIDLSTVQGTGSDGMVVVSDIEAVITAD